MGRGSALPLRCRAEPRPTAELCTETQVSLDFLDPERVFYLSTATREKFICPALAGVALAIGYQVVNPTWRTLDSKVRRAAAELSRARAAFGAHTLGDQESEPEIAARHEDKKGAALSALEAKQSQLDALKIQRKANPIHDATLQAMCIELNSMEICYPGTNLRLVYRPIRSSVFPAGQNV